MNWISYGCLSVYLLGDAAILAITGLNCLLVHYIIGEKRLWQKGFSLKNVSLIINTFS
jgi:hypothetical protein